MEGYKYLPRVNESNDNQTPERNVAYTNLFGPIVGTFTPTAITEGGHPQDVQRALMGVAFPVRLRTMDVTVGGSVVLVCADEVLDVLAAAGTPTPVLRYWQECSIDDERATIAFPLAAGELSLR